MITKKEFKEILLDISLADLRDPVEFFDTEDSILHPVKFELWYKYLKNYITKQNKDFVVDHIINNEKTYPRISKWIRICKHSDEAIAIRRTQSLFV